MQWILLCSMLFAADTLSGQLALAQSCGYTSQQPSQLVTYTP